MSVMDAEAANAVLRCVGLRVREMPIEDIGPEPGDGDQVIVPAQADYTQLVCLTLATRLLLTKKVVDIVETIALNPCPLGTPEWVGYMEEAAREIDEMYGRTS